ncbi:MAG: hypothetical protein LC793_07835 [Thermomicrobia bacterium]|nr:hypothetical protein [Thermomicrobia bacterium]
MRARIAVGAGKTGRDVDAVGIVLGAIRALGCAILCDQRTAPTPAITRTYLAPASPTSRTTT